MGYVNVRDALEVSSNLVAIKAAMLVGSDVSKEYAEKFGFVLPPEEYRGLSMYALGQYANIDGKDGANPLIMASAFGSFANNGFKNKSVYYTKVVDPAGNVVLENQPAGEQVVQPGTAYIMWDLLKSVVDHSVPEMNGPTISRWPEKPAQPPIIGNCGLWVQPPVIRQLSLSATMITPKSSTRIPEAFWAPPAALPPYSEKSWNSPMKARKPSNRPFRTPSEVAVSHDSGTLPTSLTRTIPEATGRFMNISSKIVSPRSSITSMLPWK